MKSEGGSGEETTGKKRSFCRGLRLKKGCQFLGKNRRYQQLQPRVTPTLVTPLTGSSIDHMTADSGCSLQVCL